MRALITILDNITETSMPFNEFVLYRANHIPEEKQILIVCGPKKELPMVAIPENLEIHYAGRRLSKIRKTVKRAIADCRANGISYAVHLHQVKSGFLTQVAMVGTGFRKKVLFTVHNTFSGYAFHNKVLSFFNALLARRVVCVSKTAFESYPKPIRKAKKERICAILNGFDTERIDAVVGDTVRHGQAGADFIYVARIVPVKNHAFLIRVLQKCDPGVHFTFIGAEDPEGAIRRQALQAGLSDRVSFSGLIPRNAVFERLAGGDYYLSSSTLEGLPVSVLEAMYCGLPCVLSDIPQHREAAEPVAAAILPLKEDLWAAELNRLAALPGEEREVMRARSRAHARDLFSLSAMHRQYDAVYDTLR